uniref:Component of histone deacetyl n=1 Tax=Heterorhabditis bacteriophora TaxID=37862 RepID=A0A1I7XN96_HETBA
MAEEERQESDTERDLSDSDSEELDTAEFERRKELCLRQIILAEIQFNKIKLLLKDIKIKQLEKRREQIILQTAPDFITKRNEIVEEYNIRDKLTETIRCLERDSLERRTIGLKKIAITNQEDNKIVAKESIREEILADIEKWRQRQFSSKITLSHFTQKKSGFKRSFPDVDYSEIEAKRASLNVPTLIHRLKETEIEDDLRSVELAILVSEVRDREGAEIANKYHGVGINYHDGVT